MVGINKAPLIDDLESIFSRVKAGIAPKAFGRGQIVALIVQNPLLRADRTANNSPVWIGNATNQIWYLLPGAETPVLYAEDLKDLYLKIDFPAANPNGEILTIAPNDAGTGYTVGDLLILQFPGAGLATVTVATTNTGITAATLNAGGAGYVPGDTVTVDGGGTLAILTVLTVDGGGAVLTFSITSAGNGYAVAAGVATTATTGVGAGFKVNITEVLGSILTVTVTDGGTGYQVDDEITDVSGGTGDDATFTVLTVDTVTPELTEVSVLIYRKREGQKQ